LWFVCELSRIRFAAVLYCFKCMVNDHYCCFNAKTLFTFWTNVSCILSHVIILSADMDVEICSSTEIVKDVAFQQKRSTRLNTLYHLLLLFFYFLVLWNSLWKFTRSHARWLYDGCIVCTLYKCKISSSFCCNVAQKSD